MQTKIAVALLLAIILGSLIVLAIIPGANADTWQKPNITISIEDNQHITEQRTKIILGYN